MITLLGSLLGFISAIFPHLLKMWGDAQDKKHEIAILRLQMEASAQNHEERLNEIGATADIEQYKALYTTYNSSIKWVDAYNATVRPTIAYSFFFLYFGLKIFQALHGLPWLVWTEEDQALFAGIISFYYGNRSFQKLRG